MSHTDAHAAQTPAHTLCAVLRGKGTVSVADWPALAATARQHGLAPMLYLELERAAPPPTEEVRRALHDELTRVSATNLSMYEGLRRVLAALREAGVDAIVLKGAALASSVYPTTAARPALDVDLLVRRAQLAAAAEALARLGYVRWADQGLAEGYYERWRKSREVASTSGRLPVLDLHWHLLDRNWALRERLDLEWFWSQSEVVAVDGAPGTTMRRLRPEANTLYLCLHADYHGVTGRLLWLYDIHRLVKESAGFDWALLDGAVDSMGCRRAVGGVLAAVHERFGTAVPEKVLGWAAADRAAAERSLVMLQRKGALPENVVDVLNSLTMPTWRQRLAYLREQLLPSAGFMRRRYGLDHGALLALLPLAYVYRWCRGLAGAARATVGWLQLRARGEL